METLICTAMPCVLVVLSLWRIAKAGLRLSALSRSETPWLALYVAINAMASMWAAKVLSSLEPSFQLAAEVKDAALHTGPAMFLVLALLLFARPLGNLLSRGISGLSSAIAFPFKAIARRRRG